eukprot:1353409-Rhodomonas_salina.1
MVGMENWRVGEIGEMEDWGSGGLVSGEWRVESGEWRVESGRVEEGAAWSGEGQRDAGQRAGHRRDSEREK